MLIVACVKWGTKYPPRYVNTLRNMVARHLSLPHEFACLTDDPAGLDQGIRIIPLPEGQRGFWNKLVLFRPGTFEAGRTVLYFDLDVVIVGPIDRLATSIDRLTSCWNFTAKHTMNSSVLAFRAGDDCDIWERFVAEGGEAPAASFGGDQDFIYRCQPNVALFPRGLIGSYKRTMNGNAYAWLKKLGFPTARLRAPAWLKAKVQHSASVIVFHGTPNPPDVMDGPFGPYKHAPFVAEHWR